MRILEEIHEARRSLEQLAREVARDMVTFERLLDIERPDLTAPDKRAIAELEHLVRATQKTIDEIRALSDHVHDWKPIPDASFLDPNARCTVCHMETFYPTSHFPLGGRSL